MTEKTIDTTSPSPEEYAAGARAAIAYRMANAEPRGRR
jgi:hypothetical protein